MLLGEVKVDITPSIGKVLRVSFNDSMFICTDGLSDCIIGLKNAFSKLCF